MGCMIDFQLSIIQSQCNDQQLWDRKGQKFRSSKVIEKKEPIKKQFHLIYFSNLQVIPDRNSVEGSLLYVSDLVVLEKYVCGLNIYKWISQ